ncbi:MAG: acyl-CoA thioesterase [Deltaproteobacteria bacterium]|nr:acyl-CoA thioesterase [Deltaproteobacteria bacterium]
MDRNLAIRVILLPKDTNAHGTIFGGVILSHLDLAGAVEARRHTKRKVVTVAMNAVEFHEPVFVGDVVSFYSSLVRLGTTSIRVRVEVEAQRVADSTQLVKVTSAEVAYVAVDEEGRKAPL